MLEKISWWIVRNRVLISIMSIGILLLSLVGMSQLQVNYDFNDYLPQNLSSIKGIEILTEEFGGSETVFVIISDESIIDVNEINDRLKEMPEVSETFWYSDVANVYIPDAYIDEEYKEQFFIGDSTIIQVKLRDNGLSVTQQVENIKEKIGGDDVHLTGSFVYAEEMKKMGENVKSLMLIMALIISLLVLGFAITQPAYAILFLLVTGISIIFNFGLTALLRGEMSFVSSSVTAAMQIAVTLDYAVFLLHRFEEERGLNKNHVKAMATAIAKTSVSLFSSGLTTAVGFLALVIMSYKMMGDMGLVMAQGVGIGFILTLTLLPALILFLEKPLSRLKHRQWIPSFAGLGRFIMKNRVVIVVIFVVVAGVASFGHFNLIVSYDTTEGFELSEQVQSDFEIIEESFGAGKEVTVILTDMNVDERLAIENELSEIEGIESVFGPLNLGTIYIPNSFIPQKIVDRLSSGNRHLLMVKLESGNKEFSDSVFEDLQDFEAEHEDEVIITGQDVLQYDMARVSEPDLNNVTIVSVIAIFLILLFTLRKSWQALIIVIAIEVAIWINVSFLFYAGIANTFFTSFVALSAIQLGATVDYCILLTTRFNEEKAKAGVSVTEAMIAAIKGAGPAIITASGTLFGATLAISLVSKISMVSSMTMLFARGAVVSMFVVILVLPALLVMVENIKLSKKRRVKNA